MPTSRQRALSSKVSHLAKSEPSRFGWLSIGAKAARAIETANGISILPAVNATTRKPVTPSARRLRRPVPPAAMTS